MNNIWIWAEERQGKLMEVSLELLNKGRQLADELKTDLAAVLLTDVDNTVSRMLIEYGADRVYVVEDPSLKLYQNDVYTGIITDLIKQYQPQIVLLGGTSIGMDLAPRVAARLKTGLTAHCMDLRIEQLNDISCMIATVPGWSGNLMVNIACPQKRPQMATVRPGIIARAARDIDRKGEIIKVEARIKQENTGIQTIEMIEQPPVGMPLETTDIVVAGGWGLKSAEGFGLVQELAGVLNAAIAGTRPALDAGWISEEQMLGSSGKTISPKLLISIGASGQIQFTTGFLNAKVIMAINDNPGSPIFEICDIGLVGDARQIVPLLTEGLKTGK